MNENENEFDNWGVPQNAIQQEQPKQDAAIDVLDDLQSLDDINSKFDSIYKDVVNANTEMQIFSSNVQRVEINNLTHVLGTQKDISDREDHTEDLDTLLNTKSNDILKIFNNSSIQNNRKQVYNLYNEISEINPIAYRMLRVYIDNILVKDIQNKQFINIIENDSNILLSNVEERTKKNINSFMKTVLIYFDIQKKLKNNIIHNMLKYGDFYMEIVDLSPINSLVQKKQELITENITIYPNENDKIKNQQLLNVL